jgi:hypothetical protein
MIPVIIKASSLPHINTLPGLAVQLPAGLTLADGAAHRVVAQTVHTVLGIAQTLVDVLAVGWIRNSWKFAEFRVFAKFRFALYFNPNPQGYGI